MFHINVYSKNKVMGKLYKFGTQEQDNDILKMLSNLLPLLTITTFEDCVTSILGVVVGSEMKNILGNYDGNSFHAEKF